MNDKFERRGLLKLLSDSLIMLIRIVEFKEVLEQANYFCLTVRIVYNMLFQHLCDTGPSMLDARGHTSLTLCVPITMITRRVFHVNYLF